MEVKDKSQAEQTEEIQSAQDSPTEEQIVEEQDQGSEAQGDEVAEETTQDKNWKALREENERFKKRIAELETPGTPEESPLQDVKRSPAVEFYLTPEVQARLSMDEMKAEMQVPELEKDVLFAEAVAGKYRREIDAYVSQLAKGADPRSIPLPSVTKIAKQTKSVWDTRFGSTLKKGEEEGAKKARISVQEKQSTTEAEGRSDRATRAQSATDLDTLRRRTREGDPMAIMERLKNLQ